MNKHTQVNDLANSSPDDTTPPVESGQLPKDNQIDDLLLELAEECGIINADITELRAALATAIREAIPEKYDENEITRLVQIGSKITANSRAGANIVIDQIRANLKDIGLEV